MNVTPDLLKRYASGEATAAEIRLVEAWMRANEFDEKSLPALPDEAIRLARVQGRLFGKAKQELDVPEARQFWLAGAWWKLSACAALLILAGFGIWRKRQQQEIAQVQQSGKQVSYITVATKRGERKDVDLPDGTHIVLNVASELRYPAAFEDSVREVSLTGEAFFSVAKNPAQPFVVKTATSVTRVLGTRFNLNAYPGEPLESVAVEEGRVSFGSRVAADSKVLTAGEGAMHRSNGTLTTAPVADAFNWRKQIFAMRNERLADVCRRLEKDYDVTIHIRDRALESLTVTGTYRQASLDRILNGLSYTSDFKYKISGESVEIF